MKYVCPLIVVESIEISRKFYESTLGLEVIYDFGENVTFRGDFAIHLKSHYSNLIQGREIMPAGNNFELYFEHDELEQLQENLKSQGVSVVHEIREEPWRQRVMRVTDPDGYIVEIGEPLPLLCYRLRTEGLSTEEISRCTYLPPEAVEQFIQSYTANE